VKYTTVKADSGLIVLKFPPIKPRRRIRRALHINRIPAITLEPGVKYPAELKVEIKTDEGKILTQDETPKLMLGTSNFRIMDEENAKEHCRNQALLGISLLTLILVAFSIVISLSKVFNFFPHPSSQSRFDPSSFVQHLG